MAAGDAGYKFGELSEWVGGLVACILGMLLVCVTCGVAVAPLTPMTQPLFVNKELKDFRVRMRKG